MNSARTALAAAEESGDSAVIGIANESLSKRLKSQQLLQEVLKAEAAVRAATKSGELPLYVKLNSAFSSLDLTQGQTVENTVGGVKTHIQLGSIYWTISGCGGDSAVAAFSLVSVGPAWFLLCHLCMHNGWLFRVFGLDWCGVGVSGDAPLIAAANRSLEQRKQASVAEEKAALLSAMDPEAKAAAYQKMSPVENAAAPTHTSPKLNSHCGAKIAITGLGASRKKNSSPNGAAPDTSPASFAVRAHTFVSHFRL